MALPIVFEGRTGAQIAGDLNAELGALGAEAQKLTDDGLTAGGNSLTPSQRAEVVGGLSGYSSGWVAELLPKTVANLNKVRAGISDFKVDFIGTSTTGDAGGLRLGSWANRFAQVLSAMDGSLQSNTDAFAGMSNSTTIAQVIAADARLAFGAGWQISAQFSYGGHIVNCPNTSTANLSFTPEKAWNSVEIEYLTNPSFGSMTLAAGASVFQTINTATPGFTVEKATYTTGSAAALQVLNIARSTGGSIFPLSVRTFDSAKKQILVCNAGSHSSNSALWSGNGLLAHYGALSRLTKRAANMLVIAHGVNDWNDPARTVEDFISRINTIVDTQQATGGEVILCVEPQSNPAAYATAARQTEFRNALFQIAKTQGVPIISVYDRWGAYSVANTNGNMMDDRHPSYQGGYDWGASLARLVLSL